MASLHKLLSKEGFDSRKSRKKVKFRDHNVREDSIALPIFICHDRRSFDSSWQKAEKAPSLKGSSVISSKRGGSGSEKSKARSTGEETRRRSDEPAIDDVAVKAMVSILTGYIGQYLRDKNFRESLKEQCRSIALKRKKRHSDNEIFAHMELCIQNIERMVENQERKKEMDLESLQNSIKLLKIVASLDSKSPRYGSNCATANSYLSAFAHLYLSIVYKIAKNDRISARHLLQVFSDSPFMARTQLLPEIWEHFFLPHLLHLKIWYTKELEFLSSSWYVDKEKKIEALREQYNDVVDNGTTKFALYYSEWLKVGGQAPSVPSVPLPSKPSYAHSRRRSADSSAPNHSTSNKSLYQAVFGPTIKGRSVDLDNECGALENLWDIEEQEKVSSAGRGLSNSNHFEKQVLAQGKSSSQNYRIQKAELWPENKKSDSFRFLACRTEPTELLAQGNYVSGNNKIKHDESFHLFQLNDMTKAIATICSSESLSNCEMAIRALSECWLNSQGDPTIITLLSQASVIQGIMEVLFVSNDDEIIELAVSILAELSTKSEMNRRHILNSDPLLEVSIRLLRSTNLFLKAAALLYLLKPKAKQMISMEWIPLVLRVLEFGDQTQTLFSVRCNPHEAAYYFLNQLLTGFDEDRHLENARQIISVGGLSLLVRRMHMGEITEKCKAASILCSCIEADGSCRHYLARNLKTDTIISLLVLGKQTNDHVNAIAILTELLCLSRLNQRIEILTALTRGWDCLSTMQILLSYLHRAQPEEQPICAVILLQLDLMGNPLDFSIYRVEAIDAIVKALDCWCFEEKIQEQTAKALLVLGGKFSYTGEPEIERWLLRKAGFHQYIENSFRGKDKYLYLSEEDKTWDNWQNKAAVALLISGNTRLLAALSDSIANGIPCLARASLVTVCWMSNVLDSLGNKDLQFSACSVLVPPLMECLNYNSTIEERVLASSSLLGLTKGTDYFSKVSWSGNEDMGCLHKLSGVTWTAKELISLISSS